MIYFTTENDTVLAPNQMPILNLSGKLKIL